MSLLGIIYFIFILGIIVVVHEGGHLIFAKRNNTYCHEFSIGMGPKIWHFYTDESGTEYNLRAIPLGGYVRIAGEDTGDEADEKVPKDQRFDNKSKWARFKILVAGATMNFVIGITIFILIGFFAGVNQVDTNTNQVTVFESSPIANVGVVTGDSIESVDGTVVNNYEEIVSSLDGKDQVNITYSHEGSIKDATVKKDKDGKIGISIYQTEVKYDPIASIIYGFKMLWLTIYQTFLSIFLLFSGQASVSDLAGPVGIATMSSGFFSLGLVSSLKWLAFLSMAIGVMNLLPIPALDGGRIVFIGIEAIIGRPVNPKIENTLNNIVFFGLIALIIFVTFFDIGRIGEVSDFFSKLQ